MPAGTDLGADPGGQGHAVVVEQRAVDLAQGGGGLHGERPVLLVEVDRAHGRGVDEHTDVAVVGEVLEAVPAAADRDPLPGRHGVRDDLVDLPGRVDHVHEVRRPDEAGVESPADQFAVPGVGGGDRGDR